jgi:MtN3 and saliva related transmembrane protein
VNVPDLLITALGVGAAVCTITSFLPQIIKIARERDASSVSFRTYALTVSAFTLWTAYGVLTKAWPVAGANAVSLCLAATALFFKWKFRDGPDSA